MGFGRRSLLTKLYAAMVLAVLPLLLVQPLYVLPTIREQLYEDRVRAVRQLVESAHGILQVYEARERAGELSPQEARAAAAKLLEGLRYSGNEYFWVNDLQARLLMHPYLPQRIGEDMRGYRDAAGKAVFSDIVVLARRQGEGSIGYLATRPGEPEPIPKVSYVKLFAPWGWVLGTGVYVEDIEQEVAAVQRRLLLALAVGLGLVGLMGLYFSRRVVQPVRALAEAAGRVAAGDLSVTVTAPSHDEVGELGRAFNIMVVAIQDLLRGMAEVARATAVDAGHIRQSARQLTHSSQEQSQALVQMTGSVAQVSQGVSLGAQQTRMAAKAAEVNGQVAREGGVVVRSTGEKMGEIARVVERSAKTVGQLHASSEQVAQAVELIRDVADQTRVLAVNTAIEAARAGEHGRGLTVVGLEVRKLAEQAHAAAARIGQMMEESRAETEAAARLMQEGRARVQEGLALSARTGQALERIVAGAEEIGERLQSLAQAHARQSEAGESLTFRIQGLSERSAESALGVEQIAQAVQDLEARANQLRTLVARYTSPLSSSPRQAALDTTPDESLGKSNPTASP